MADWGIKISKPGFDVKTCADKDLVMSSKLDLFKVAKIGSTSGSAAHGLGYPPAFLASFYYDGGQWGWSGQYFSCLADSTSNVFEVSGATFTYYLFHYQGG